MSSLADVAKEAGVSLGVASRVLSGKRTTIPISTTTKARVKDAAERLDYVPDFRARLLRQKSSPMLGVLAHSLSGSFRPHLLHCLSQQLVERDKELLFGVHLDNLDMALRGIRIFRAYKTFAVLTIGAEEIAEQAAGALAAGSKECGPQAALSFVCERKGVPCVYVDLAWAIGEFVRLMRADGRDGVAVLVRKDSFSDGHIRSAFQASLDSEEGMAGRVEELESDDVVSVVKRVLAWRKAGGIQGPIGLFTDTDAVAAQAAKVLLGLGVNVPGDVAIVGYGNRTLAQYATPTITTFDVLGLFPAMARVVTAMIDTLTADEAAQPQSRAFRPPLLVRESFVPRGAMRSQ